MDAERWAAHVETARRSGVYIAHEPLEGPVFCVETRSSNGMHQVVSISSGQAHQEQSSAPVPSDEAELAVLRSAVTAVLDLARYESGVARTDVVLTARGPRISALRLDAATNREAE